MAMRSTVMAFDFNTPGAIFLFLVLVGLLNVLFKVVGRSRERALVAAVGAVGLFLAWYGPRGELDFHSPGLLFNLFIVSSILINLLLVWNGLTLVLNRAELVLVYVMLLVVSGPVHYGDEPAVAAGYHSLLLLRPRPKINGWKSCCRICRHTKCWSTTGGRIGPFTKE